MANRTVKDAKSIRGTNPQYLIEKITRTRIYECKYWKEECFALTAELLVDKAMELRFIGGIFGGNVKPTPFLCLTLKMLQIQPEKDIIVEFIKNEEFKYVRALGALYMRLTGTALDCYKYLEPLFNDSRKLRVQNKQGEFEIIHMDEFIDQLLKDERSCDIILPRIQKRYVLEENNELEARISALEDDMDENIESSDDDDEDDDNVQLPPPTQVSSSSHDDIRKRIDDYERDRNRDRDHRHHRSHDRRRSDRNDRASGRERERSRSRDRERDRHHLSSSSSSSRRERERDRRRRDDRDDRDNHRERRDRRH